MEQLVSVSQTRAIGDSLILLLKRHMDGERTIPELLDLLESDFLADGLDALSPRRLGCYARPRRHEVAAALNRLRTLDVRQVG